MNRLPAAAKAARRRKADTAPPSPDIAERLLNAAAQVLVARGERGFKVVDVAAAAGANVAMINYHFGSRDGLITEVLRRGGAEVASAREALMDALPATADAAPLSVPAIVRCWLAPVRTAVNAPERAGMLMLAAHLVFAADVDTHLKQRMLDDVLRVDARFLDALARSLPHLTRSAIAWRMSCAVGGYCLVLGQRDALAWRVMTGAQAPDADEAFEELVAFVVGGLQAPAAVVDAAAAPAPSPPPRPARRRRTG